MNILRARRCLRVLFLPLCLLAGPGLTHAGVTDTPFPAADPESHGLSKDALDSLAAVVRSYLEKDLIVGAELLVIKDRHTMLHEVFGWRDRESKTPMTRNTVFNIRSMTKPLTGAAIQILIDEGKLGPEDRAAKYLPGFDNEKSGSITIEQLLSHRSGLPLTVYTIGPRQYPDLQTVAETAGKQGPEFPPGSKFWYSDAGSDVLGAVVEKISGTALDDFWRQHLLAPLGMQDTFCASDKVDRKNDTRWERLASLYLLNRNAKDSRWVPYWKPAGQPLYPFAWGSQTLYSTPADYARFLALWMDGGVVGNRRVLSREAMARTLSPVSEMKSLGSDRPYPTGFLGLKPFYGQMSVLYRKPESDEATKPVVIGHSGSDGTWAWAWPELDLMVLYFTQSRGQSTGVALEYQIQKILARPEPSAAAKQAAAENPMLVRMQGEWEGRIVLSETRGQDVLWRFELSDTGDLVGFMGPAERGLATIPMANIVLSETELRFDVPSQAGRYEGSISDGEITGTWRQRGGAGSLKMSKINGMEQ